LGTFSNSFFGFRPDLCPHLAAIKIWQYTKYSRIFIPQSEAKSLAQSTKTEFSKAALWAELKLCANKKADAQHPHNILAKSLLGRWNINPFACCWG
jgi:hypothetical protein